jgi:signal transduction histidine kinase
MAMNKEILVEKIFPKKTLVYADRYMFDTILRNLISNAIKYSNKGGRIKISGEETKNELIMRITDSGIGISSSVKNRIFRKEENFSTKGTDGETGTGLGLLITKEFVEKHGGRIGVESKQGKGTTIWFTLPYNKEAEKTWRNCRNTKSPEQILFK